MVTEARTRGPDGDRLSPTKWRGYCPTCASLQDPWACFLPDAVRAYRTNMLRTLDGVFFKYRKP